MGKSRGVLFFATTSDLLLVLNEVETGRPVQYVLSGAFEDAEIQAWASGVDLPGLGIADADQSVACRTFLVANAETKILSRSVWQFDGRTRFDVDQLVNPDSVAFTPAGEWKQMMMIAGRFATASDSPISLSMMTLMRRAVKRYFTRVQAFWVGPEALNRFRAGLRLTYADQSPAVYDLEEPRVPCN